METKIVKVDENKIDRKLMDYGGQLIRQGELVSFPTETVYGLGADGLNPQAIKKIFKAKGRPGDNPLILHIAELEELYPLVEEVTEDALKLAEAFWPGPLTIILKRSPLVPDEITAGLETVAVRMPSHKLARELIRSAGRPIAAPSANTSGKPSPTQADHVYKDLKGSLELIIDGGSTEIGLESTVVDLSTDLPTVLRPGGVTLEELRSVLGRVEIDPAIISLDEKLRPKSPGQKYRHYAPNSEMIVFQGQLDQVVDRINSLVELYEGQGKKVGIMCTDETRSSYKSGLIYSMGSRQDLVSISHRLFHILRLMDQEEVDLILSESVGYSELGMAIMNRMLKASGGAIEIL